MFSYAELQFARTAATERLKVLKEKYSALKPYLVFSSPCGQTDLRADPVQILKDFPAMVVDSPEKTKAIGFLEEIRLAKARKESDSKLSKLNAKLTAVAQDFRFKGDTNIEFRFGSLVYRLIHTLKQEPGIDREQTMQTGASIRIVMGTVSDMFPDSLCRQ